MHPPEVKARALKLIAQGINWRRPTYVPRNPEIPHETCPRCWRPAKPMRFTPEDYSELLGLYLGDGYISEGPRTQRLRLSLDAKYPKMNREIGALLERCFPYNGVGTVKPGPTGWSDRSDTLIVLSIYSGHLGCLFPQHGPGLKHQRRIQLDAWQMALLDRAPWGFIRGCIRSDGCAFINRTGRYEYLSYEFSNKSKDIVDHFRTTCDRAGVFTRVNGAKTGRWSVRINRRESVALMCEHVGLKA